VVPTMAAIPQPVEAQTEAPAAVLGQRLIQSFDDRRITCRPIDLRPIPGRPRQADSRTRARSRSDVRFGGT
jgi:hypothetical protein